MSPQQAQQDPTKALLASVWHSQASNEVVLTVIV